MTFRIGEKVVYPNQGVGTIENITCRPSGSRPEPFYLLRFSSNSMTVLVPFSHVQQVGLRRVTTNGEIGRVLSYLSAGWCLHKQDWKDRFKENSEKMRSGNLLGVAEVLKSLLVQQQKKPLSFREKRMLDRARRMLVMELSSSRMLRESEAVQMIEKALARASLMLPDPL